jgi:hypothetical protein
MTRHMTGTREDTYSTYARGLDGLWVCTSGSIAPQSQRAQRDGYLVAPSRLYDKR